MNPQELSKEIADALVASVISKCGCEIPFIDTSYLQLLIQPVIDRHFASQPLCVAIERIGVHELSILGTILRLLEMADPQTGKRLDRDACLRVIDYVRDYIAGGEAQ